MGRRGLRRHERQFQVIDYPIHDGNLRDEGDGLHSAAALGADLRVDFIGITDHLGPARAVSIAEIIIVDK